MARQAAEQNRPGPYRDTSAAGRAGRRLMAWGAAALLAAMLIGTYLRGVLVWGWPLGTLRFGDVLHAHSHTAHFGWGGLVLIGAALVQWPRLTGRPISVQGWLRALVWLLPVAVFGAMATFSLYGYRGLSIPFATLNQVLWYGFAWLFWRQVRGLPLRRWPGALWLWAGAVLHLVIATLGTWLLVATVALGISDPLLRTAGIYLFLHAFGDGFMLLGVMAVVADLLPPAVGGRPLSARLARWQFWLTLAALPAFLRLLVPLGLPQNWALAGAIAGIALSLSHLLFLANAAIAWRSGPAPGGLAGLWWAAAAGFLLVKAAAELTPFTPWWPALVANRQLVLSDLHLKLLGVYTTALIGALIPLLDVPAGRRAAQAHVAGAAVMVISLAGAGLLSPTATLGRMWLTVAFAAALAVLAGVTWPTLRATAWLLRRGSRA